MTCRSWNKANESVWMKDAEAVWLGSPVFTVETMAAVINCVQTAPASAHSKQKRKTFRIPALRGDPQAHLQCWPWANRREPRQRGVHLLFVCVFCVRNSVKKHSGEELNDIFKGTRWPALGKVLFLLQYLHKIKSIYLWRDKDLQEYRWLTRYYD